MLFSAVVILHHLFLDLLLKLAVAYSFEPTHDLLEPLYAVMKMDAQRDKIREDKSNRYNDPNWYSHHCFIISTVREFGQWLPREFPDRSRCPFSHP